MTTEPDEKGPRKTKFGPVQFIFIVLVLIGVLLGGIRWYAAYLLEEKERGSGEPQVAAARSDLKVISSAINRYLRDFGEIPDDLSHLVRAPDNAERWDGPYIRSGRVPGDPWGSPYRYSKLSKTQYKLSSLGADGKPGGTGDDRDVQFTQSEDE